MKAKRTVGYFVQWGGSYETPTDNLRDARQIMRKRYHESPRILKITTITEVVK